MCIQVKDDRCDLFNVNKFKFEAKVGLFFKRNLNDIINLVSETKR